MFVVNKKMWSLNFGCMLAASSIWLVALGLNMPVLAIFDFSSVFIENYYASLMTAISSFLFSLFVIGVMKKGFDISASDHTFWLLIPLVTIILMALSTGAVLYLSLLSAAGPSFLVMFLFALVGHINKASLLVKAGE